VLAEVQAAVQRGERPDPDAAEAKLAGQLKRKLRPTDPD
jgi:hypothetical protein